MQIAGIRKRLIHAVVSCGVVLSAGCSPGQAPTEPAADSLLIDNVRIVDGTGAAAFAGAVRVTGERIAAVGDLEPAPGEVVIDGGGFVLAPGFIDTHSHGDDDVLECRLIQNA